MIPSHSSHLLPLSPDSPPLCALSVSVFSSLASPFNFKLSTSNFLWGFCSGGSSDPCLSPTPLPSNSSLSRSPMAVRHQLSTEDPDPVGTVSRFTPSTNVDALDAASSISPLFATLTKNTGGWGIPHSRVFSNRSPLPVHYPYSLLSRNNAPPRPSNNSAGKCAWEVPEWPEL
jgi:hypothetical protein